jgi:hypothetical protein
VRNGSWICPEFYAGEAGFISHALEKRRVGLEATDEDGVMNVWFGPRRLGQIDFNETPSRLKPEPWLGSEVSPMGAE